uniref:Peroxisomal biogenesis factor 5-like n=1 Tax=Jaculus jaculus TaxID=51337 RepID=A0A8C5JX56_JACJA
MSDNEMDGRNHIPSLLNVLLSRNRVMQMSYLKSKEQGYGKLSNDEDLEIIVDQKQLVNEQQESRPLLSPSIDDFLCETKSEAIARPVTSNTAVLTTGLDLLDLSEPVSQTQTKGKKSEPSSKSSSLKKKADGPDLISTDAEQRGQSIRGPETSSLDIQTQLEKWEDVKFHGDRNSKGHPMTERKPCSSRTGSKELLWSAEHRSQPELSTGKSALNSESASELELVTPAQARLTREHRWGSALLSRNHSLEEEFERAKAAVESDTEFWDKMQAEWEEMARRNWISENQEAQNQVTISASEKGYYFHTENPFKDWPGAFEEGLKRLKEGDLPVTILFMEAAILQDPGDAEAWQFLGITQAENENEQAAIVALQRCLELQPNNLKALMALAVSYTNTGHQQDACEALKNWIRQNPKYKHLVKNKKASPGLTRRMSKSPVDREAVSNFLTALSLQRKSRNQQQVPHPAISGNIWAALRIALSLMDQPELFQAANLGDLDVLLRAFNLDP